MSYKDQRQEMDLAPAGSLAPLNSTQDGSKWHHGVDTASLSKLMKLSTEINKITEDTAVTVAKAQIKVGRLLNEARALIPGDLQFGQWREANTAITNKSTANKLMNLAKQVGDGRITQELLDALPMSSLKELISAPDAVVASTIRMVVEDKVIPTREQIREEVKEVKSGGRSNATGQDASHAAPKAPAKPAAPPADAIVNVRMVVDKTIEKGLIERLRVLNPKGDMLYKSIKPLEWAFLVFGLDPDPASYPNPQVIEILHSAYMGEVQAWAKDSEELEATMSKAYAIIMEAYA